MWDFYKVMYRGKEKARIYCMGLGFSQGYMVAI